MMSAPVFGIKQISVLIVIMLDANPQYRNIRCVTTLRFHTPARTFHESIKSERWNPEKSLN